MKHLFIFALLAVAFAAPAEEPTNESTSNIQRRAVQPARALAKPAPKTVTKPSTAFKPSTKPKAQPLPIPKAQSVPKPKPTLPPKPLTTVVPEYSFAPETEAPEYKEPLPSLVPLQPNIVTPKPIALTPSLPIEAFNPVLSARSNAGDVNAEVISYQNEVNPDGTYKYSFALDNGIAVAEEGELEKSADDFDLLSRSVSGSFSWNSPEGIPISIVYKADKNGYQPEGDVIPTSPPIPPLIAKSLQWLANQLALRAASSNV